MPCWTPSTCPNMPPATTPRLATDTYVVGTYAPRDDAWWQGQRTVGISSITRGLEPSANHDAWLTVEQTFVDALSLTGETSQAGAPVGTTDGDVDSLTALGEGVQEIAGAMDLRGGTSHSAPGSTR